MKDQITAGSSSLSSEILMDLLKGGQDTKTKKDLDAVRSGDCRRSQ